MDGKHSNPESLRGGGEYDEKLGFVPDTISVWIRIANPLGPGADRFEEDLQALFNIAVAQDLPTYEEYLRIHYNPADAERLIAQTPEANKQQFNALVAEFNSQREQIKKAGSKEGLTALRDFWSRAQALILKR